MNSDMTNPTSEYESGVGLEQNFNWKQSTLIFLQCAILKPLR